MRRFPCRGIDTHLIEEDGVRLERDGPSRVLYVLGTCRRCGVRLQKRYNLSERGDWRPVPVDQQQASA